MMPQIQDTFRVPNYDMNWGCSITVHLRFPGLQNPILKAWRYSRRRLVSDDFVCHEQYGVARWFVRRICAIIMSYLLIRLFIHSAWWKLVWNGMIVTVWPRESSSEALFQESISVKCTISRRYRCHTCWMMMIFNSKYASMIIGSCHIMTLFRTNYVKDVLINNK